MAIVLASRMVGVITATADSADARRNYCIPLCIDYCNTLRFLPQYVYKKARFERDGSWQIIHRRPFVDKLDDQYNDRRSV